MKTIKWCLHTGFAGVKHEGEFEVDDDTTDEEINKMVREEAFNYIDLGWQVVQYP